MLHLPLLFSLFVHTGAYAQDAPAYVLSPTLDSLTKDRAFKGASFAVQVVDVASGEEVWAHEADLALNPASTTKILTAATALKNLGPAYVFRTVVFADEPPSSDGSVPNLYVRGGGDPTMVVEKLWKIVRDLELAGLSKVKGDLVLDESFFGPDHLLPGWGKARDVERGASYFPALSALSLNFNAAAIVVRPGAVGKAAVVELDTPAGDYIEVVSKVTTGKAGGRRHIAIDREDKGSKMVFTVTGTVPANDSSRRFYRSIGDPTAYFGAVLRTLLTERGITVGGKIRTGEVPKGAEYLTELQSHPLTNVLMDMNKFSSNFMAEQVLRTVGAEVLKDGTTAGGLKVMTQYLKEAGVPDGFRLFNGSGLAQEGALSPVMLTSVLLDMARDPRVGHEFQTSLAIAGVDGTLRSRLRDEPSRMRGKTGTLDGVHCLTGYLEAADGRIYAFAFLANGFQGGSTGVKAVHDEFARRMFLVSKDAAADKPQE